jgi:hypothetical protein
MSGAVPPLPNTRSWRGAQLKKTGTFYPLARKLDGRQRCYGRRGKEKHPYLYPESNSDRKRVDEKYSEKKHSE